MRSRQAPAWISSAPGGRGGASAAGLPREGQFIDVCFLNIDNVKKWYTAEVTRVVEYDNENDVLGAACLKYAAAHGHEAEENEVRFMRSGGLRTLVGGNLDDGTSDWRVRRNLKVSPAKQIRSIVSRPKIRRVPSKRKARTLLNDPQPPRERAPNPPTLVQDISTAAANVLNEGNNGDHRDLTRRVSLLEAQVLVLHHQRPSEFAAEVYHELRVDMKIGILEELMKSPKRVTMSDGIQYLDGALRAGYATFSMDCALPRFKELTRYLVDFFLTENTNVLSDKVRFSPGLEVIDGPAGLPEAKICFADGVEFFNYIGATREDDILTLLRTSFEADGPNVRILGGLLQHECGENEGKYEFFPGMSCLHNNVGTHSEILSETLSSAIRIDASSWDAEGRALATPPTVEASRALFMGTPTNSLCCFQIRWETEKPRRQRKLLALSCGTEGVRRGSVHVQVPYVAFGPELAPAMDELCCQKELARFLL